MNKNKIISAFLLALLIAFLAIRLILIGRIDLIPEETYYWEWSRHLALSYYDMSPMIAYLIAFTTLFGKLNSQFFVRLGGPLITLSLSVFVYLILKKVTGARITPLIWAVLLNFVPILNIGSILIVYGNLQILFFSLTVLFIVYLIITKNDFYWYLIGISTGLALLSKYTAGFLYLILFSFLVLSKNYRKYFLKKEPYIAFLISFLLFSPVIIWNYQNNFVSFRHLMTLSGHSGGIGIFLSNLILFLGSQAGIVSPFIYLFMLISIFAGLYMAFKENNDLYLSLSLAALIPFLYFIYQSTKTMVQPNWPVFLYFPAYILSFILIRRFYLSLDIPMAKKAVILYLAFSFAVGLSFSVIMFFEPYHPLVNISISKSPLRDILGWKKLGSLAGKELGKHKKDDLLLLARRFQTASELAYYTPGKPYVYSFNYYFRNNEYSIWNNFKNKKGRNFLYVIDTKYGKNIETRLCDNFKSCTLVKSITLRHKGQKVRTIKMYILKDFLYRDKYMFREFSSPEF